MDGRREIFWSSGFRFGVCNLAREFVFECVEGRDHLVSSIHYDQRSGNTLQIWIGFVNRGVFYLPEEADQ